MAALNNKKWKKNADISTPKRGFVKLGHTKQNHNGLSQKYMYKLLFLVETVHKWTVNKKKCWNIHVIRDHSYKSFISRFIYFLCQQ